MSASRWVALRRRLGAVLIRTLLEGLSGLARLWPSMRRACRALSVTKDLAYGEDPLQRLDVWKRPNLPPDAPCVLLVHGGGFRILSKATHWMMAMRFAEAGYVVFTIDYRLAPEVPFPAAIEDTCRAYLWVLDHAKAHGADPSRMAFAGESAGGNLILALTLACCAKRPEPWAAEVFARGVTPQALLPICGFLQVTEPERFAARPMPTLFRDRIVEVCRGYLGAHPLEPRPETALADPLLWLESDAEPSRPLPPMYLAVGSADPVEEDTHRLAAACHRVLVWHQRVVDS